MWPIQAVNYSLNVPPEQLSQRKHLNPNRYRDGVTVFLNGNEIFRGNVQADSGSQSTADSRGSDRQGTGIVFPIRSETLRPTDNCLALSLHQCSAYSASPLLSPSIGKVPSFSDGFESLPAGGKSALCRVIAQAGGEIPDAAAILKKLQKDDSESVRIAAAVAAAMNDIPVTMLDLTEPEAYQKLFEQVLHLNEDAWKIVESPKFTNAQYMDALRMASAACNLKTKVHPELKAGVAGVENTLAVAFYRCGQYEKAVEKLKESLEIAGENPVDVAFLSLAYHRLGQEEESQKSRMHFDELLKKEEWQHSPTAFKVRKELKTAFNE